MPDEQPSLAKCLMDYGAAMQRMSDVSDIVSSTVERFKGVLSDSSREASDSSSIQEVAHVTELTTRAVDEYTKLTRAYCAGVQEVCDRYEKGKK